MSTKSASPSVDTHQIMSAGLAATGAAFVTSRFGVAGTLLGAALTAMIMTGGSAILRAYIENASSRVRGGVTRFRGRGPEGAPHAAEQAPTREAPRGTLPGRPDLLNNGVGRLRAALDWFRNLPTPSRRPILIKALVAAGVAFVICMFAVWGVEKLIGNSLSCGIWSSCPYGAAPGIHPAGFDDSGARSSIAGGGVNLGGGGGGGVIDSLRQNPVVPDGPDILPGGADSSASPAPDGGGSASPAADPAADPAGEAPSSASPAAGQDASPAAEDKAAPADASASPAP